MEFEQVTSEQILEQADAIRQKPLNAPSQTIQDLEELRSYQLIKRKEYEQQLNKNRLNFGQWLRYAKWEAQENHDLSRARSIYERALDVDIQHIPFWVQYIQFELAHKAINHARNLLDRATTTLPRVNKLWFLYVQTEEILKNVEGVRNIFERWLSWHPDKSPWIAYINFEKRQKEFENVRQIYMKYVKSFNLQEAWLDWVGFEIEQNNLGNTRYIFEISIEPLLKKQQPVSELILKWTTWETSLGEYERARKIFQIVIESNILEEEKVIVYNSFSKFEKLYGDNDSVSVTMSTKKKISYQQALKEDPFDYDTWWAYINLLIQQHEPPRDTFEKAILSVPKETFKSVRWKRYIFIWIRYCFWEEFTNKNVDSARKLWNRCIEAIPHSSFTFGKVWIEYVQFELRNNEEKLTTGRKFLGIAIGKTSQKVPKVKILRYYIELEKRIGEFDRVRKLYQKWVELLVVNEFEWISVLKKYVEFESSINEDERCISLFEFALKLQQDLKLRTEPVWYEYIEFCIGEMMYDEARELYKRLTVLNGKVNNWISYALFESSIPTEEQLYEFNQSDLQELEVEVTEKHREATRKVFTKGLILQEGDEDKIRILNAWSKYEEVNGDFESQKRVEALKPKVVTKIKTVDNVETEYVEYVFPEVEEIKPKPDFSKFLNLAKNFKKEK